MFRESRYFLFRVLVGVCLSLPVAATVVRFDIDFGGQPAGSIYIQMFDADGPAGKAPAQGTVDNFLNYIDDNYLNGGGGNRRYDGTLIHRKDLDFVIQGGGFIFDPAQGPFDGGGVSAINLDGTILNEFDSTRSNLRGTIAMARQDDDDPDTTDDIDSATSQWFINLDDSNTFLDNSNGGFTVFGQVLGNGMELADVINALEVVAFAAPFNAFPVVGVPSATVDETNVVTLARVVIDPPAALSADLTEYNFGMVTIGGAPGVRTVTIQNVGGQNQSLVLGAIGGIDGLTAPFSFPVPTTGDCVAGQTLASTETCTIGIAFTPTTIGDLQESFDVSPGLTVNVRGTGTSSTPALYVTPSVLNFGNVGNGEPTERLVTVRNLGDGLLQSIVPAFSAAGEGAFSIPPERNTCSHEPLALGQTCTISVRVLSSSVGAQESATLEVTADDGSGIHAVALSATITQLQSSVQLPDSVTVPDVRFDASGATTLSITNTGVDNLYLFAVDIVQGVGDAALFAVTSTDCIDVPIAPQSSCSVDISFDPVVPGTYNAVVRVQSNDPDGTADVPVIATASQDADGVSDAIEQAAPNFGDANEDGVQDAEQESVASLPDANGRYVTFEAITAGTTLVNVEALLDPPPTGPPVPDEGTLEFQHGFFFFEIDNVTQGGQAVVTLTLPTGYTANSYFKFGRLPGEQHIFVLPHWYGFLYDPVTQTGAEFSPGIVTLNFVDGGRGDNDQSANGRIIDPGGPALFSASGKSSGGGGCSLTSRPGQLSEQSVFRLDFLMLFTLLGLFRSKFLGRCYTCNVPKTK